MPKAKPEPPPVAAEKIDRCRVCANRSLVPCMDIGSQYLSSVFPEALDYRERMKPLPLELVLCESGEDGKACGLLQLGHRLDLSAMYEAYPYTSSTNSSMGEKLKDVADSGRALGCLKPGDVVLDIGCNDGTLLGFFQDDNCDLVGIDPAKNIEMLLQSPRLKHVRDYFSQDAYASVSPKKAKLIFSVAMFYHLSDPVGFTSDAAECMADDGALIIQMVYLPAMLKTNMYDNIVHEHAGYYCVETMRWILARAGLEIFDVTLNDVYGGSFRVFAKKKGCAAYAPTERYQEILREEAQSSLANPATYADFVKRIEKTREDLKNLCASARKDGKTIWVYGASTKGNTILQYCGLGKDDIVSAADANPFKIGKYMIGADIPIRDEAAMRSVKPDYLLALPYSFVEDFMKRESALVSEGARFVVPLPELRILP